MSAVDNLIKAIEELTNGVASTKTPTAEATSVAPMTEKVSTTLVEVAESAKRNLPKGVIALGDSLGYLSDKISEFCRRSKAESDLEEAQYYLNLAKRYPNADKILKEGKEARDKIIKALEEYNM